MSEQFSHLDEQGNPRMVHVGEKKVTARMAKARALVSLPSEVLSALADKDFATKKGPVFQTAVLAGIMGSKRTSDLIPLCHPIGLDNCDVEVILREDGKVQIDCTARIAGKTGVEMEALTGATVAALTIYDMCKAFTHDIIIEEVKLMAKSGGKRNFNRPE